MIYEAGLRKGKSFLKTAETNVKRIFRKELEKERWNGYIRTWEWLKERLGTRWPEGGGGWLGGGGWR